VANIDITVRRKVWLEHDGKPLLGQGRYELLRHISKTNSLTKSATLLGVSYKTAYNYIKAMETRLGERIIDTEKGGVNAGGSTKLNSLGQMLMKRYEAAL
jgi:molybdate transport system regulatory protein